MKLEKNFFLDLGQYNTSQLAQVNSLVSTVKLFLLAGKNISVPAFE
jgi:hypothetical protein